MKYLKEIFVGADGLASMKRWIGAVGTITLTGCLVASSLKTGVTPDEHLVSSVEWITIASVFGTAIEKLGKK